MNTHECEDCEAPAATILHWFEADISGPFVGNVCQAELCLSCAAQARHALACWFES